MIHMYHIFQKCITKVYHKHSEILMKPTISIVFNRRKTASRTKKGAVEIEIYQGRKRKWVATGVTVYLHQWKNGLVVGREDAADLNLQIQAKYQSIIALFEEDETIPLDKVSLANKSKGSFLNWLEQQIEARSDVRESTKKCYWRVLHSLQEFGRIQTFEDLTTKNIVLWDAQIRTHTNTQSTVHGYHKRLKPFIKRAIQLELLKESPYDRFQVSRGKSDGIKYITEEERTIIEELPLTNGMAIVRDMFIFACYTGLADSDIRKITKKDIIRDGDKMFIKDKRVKTGSMYNLMLLPQAIAILERYDYNLDLITNQKCNQFLKAIQVMAGIRTKLTMHVGRHTFATWALKKGVRIEVVSKMLAHTNIATTQIYAKVLQEEVTKGFEQLAGE